MVVGNGLIASALKRYESNDGVLIFASGVSNSAEVVPENFNREKDLLLLHKDSNKLLVYFSTCSLFDPSVSESSYVIHKKNMEDIIKSNFDKYIILRLPTIVGYTSNPFTFFNNIKNKLLAGEAINVHNNATRYLFSVDDLYYVVDKLINNYSAPVIMNAVFDNKIKVLEIVLKMKEFLSSSSDIILQNKGADLFVENQAFIELIRNSEQSFYSSDIDQLIRKYLTSKN